MTQRHADQWGTREYPVLYHLAQLIEFENQTEITPAEVSNDLGVQLTEATKSVIALIEADYLVGEISRGVDDWPLVNSLTEKGRRAVGLWPGESDVDAMVRALENAAAGARTEEERGALRRAAAELAKVGRDLMVEIAGAMFARSAGL
jgi:hypothetical protein